MNDSTNFQDGGKEFTKECAEISDSLELVETGPGKLVLTKISSDTVFDELQIDSENLALVEPPRPDHDPYNNYYINQDDVWYRVRNVNKI